MLLSGVLVTMSGFFRAQMLWGAILHPSLEGEQGHGSRPGGDALHADPVVMLLRRRLCVRACQRSSHISPAVFFSR